MSPKYILFIIIGIALAGFAYYGISPLFRNIELNEADPSLSTPPSLPQTQIMEEQKNPEQKSAPVVNVEEQAKELVEKPATVETPLQEEIQKEIKTAQVIGTAGHPAEGVARIVGADGKKYLRYENFKTINGPDLFVYLSKDTRAGDFINLGRLKATEGNVNYEIPPDVNIQDYPYALVWCKAFSVLFNSAHVGAMQ